MNDARVNDARVNDARVNDARVKGAHIGRREVLSHAQRRARRPEAPNPLARSREGRWLGGVAAGIADFVGVGPGAVRFLWVLSLVLSLGIAGVGYLVLWLLLPVDPGVAPVPGQPSVSDHQPDRYLEELGNPG